MARTAVAIALMLDGEPDGFGSPGGLIESRQEQRYADRAVEEYFTRNGIQLKAGDGLTAVVKGTMEVRGERVVRFTEKIALKAVPPALLAALTGREERASFGTGPVACSNVTGCRAAFAASSDKRRKR